MFCEQLDKDTEVASDGRTVWINRGGVMIGRFGRGGVELEARAGGWIVIGRPTGPDDWRPFVHAVGAEHGIAVSDTHRPAHAGGITLPEPDLDTEEQRPDERHPSPLARLWRWLRGGAR